MIIRALAIQTTPIVLLLVVLVVIMRSSSRLREERAEDDQRRRGDAEVMMMMMMRMHLGLAWASIRLTGGTDDREGQGHKGQTTTGDKKSIILFLSLSLFFVLLSSL